MSTRRKKPRRRPGWEPLQEGVLPPGSAAMFEQLGLPLPDEIWGSSLYTCTVRYGTNPDGTRSDRNGLLWLSIHRLDRAAVRDWRHFQAIKNEVAGADRLAVELYPPEAEMVDTVNEYHLWVLPVGFDLPFGFDEGGTMTPDQVDATSAAARAAGHPNPKSHQRPWEAGISTGPGYGIAPGVPSSVLAANPDTLTTG